MRPREAGGLGLDAQWSDDFHHAVHAWLTGERHGYYADFGRLADLAYALEHAYVYDGRHSEHRRRRHGRSALDLSGSRFLGYAQNHDQVGNRARGERMSTLVGPAPSRLAAALVLTAPFVPLLFQGEEWGATTPFPYFCDHDDAALARAVTDGRRREFAAFGWKAEDVLDPQAPATFAAARLDWEEPTRSPHAEILAWHKDLIALRRRTPELRDGKRDGLRPRFDEARRWLAYDRGPLTVAFNFATEPQRVPVAGGTIVLASNDRAALDGAEAVLPAETVAIVARAATAR